MDSGEKTTVLNRPLLSTRFEVIKVLGDGAAGVVYHAKDKFRAGREVALKVLTNSKAFDDKTIERFREEMRISREIRHPNLVEAYELLSLDDTIAFSMEYVPGSDLAKLFRKKKFSGEQVDLIYDQLLGALEELHSHAVLHRDIKLENILLREDGTIKLSDLGLMKQYKKELTATGVILGTAHYLPPEYVREGKYDVRSEIYVLGTMLFEMVTGRRWLTELSGNKVIEHLIKTNFAFPLESLIDVDKKFRRILERSVCYKPSDRFQNVAEMRRAFAGIGTELKPIGERETLEPRVIFNSRINANVRNQPRKSSWRRLLLEMTWLLGVLLMVGIIIYLLKDFSGKLSLNR